MYITDINGREIIYYDDRIEFDSLTIYYKDMRHITQSFGDTPVFRFEYKGRNLKIPCKDDEYELVLEYFRMAADAAPKSDPLEFLSDEDIRYDGPAGSRRQSVYETLDRETFKEERNRSSGYYYGRYEGEQPPYSGPAHRIKAVNKNVFVWVFSFLLGSFGVDRFVRGQVGLGILKIVVCVFLVEMDLPFGIWATVDWIIAMVKAYGSAFKNDDCVRFDEKGAYIK